MPRCSSSSRIQVALAMLHLRSVGRVVACRPSRFTPFSEWNFSPGHYTAAAGKKPESQDGGRYGRAAPLLLEMELANWNSSETAGCMGAAPATAFCQVARRHLVARFWERYCPGRPLFTGTIAHPGGRRFARFAIPFSLCPDVVQTPPR